MYKTIKGDKLFALFKIANSVVQLTVHAVYPQTPQFGKCSLLKYFRGAAEPWKLNAQISVYNKHFVRLLFVGCHDQQKYF